MAEVAAAAAVCGMTGDSTATADFAAEAGEAVAVASVFRVTFLASIRARCTATRSGAAAAAREVGVGSERAPEKAGEAPRDAVDDEDEGGVIVCLEDPPTGLSKRVFCCAAAARVAMAGLHCCCCCLCCNPEMALLAGAAEEVDAPMGRRDVEGATDGVRTAGVAAAADAEGLNAGAAEELADLLDAATVSVALISSVFTSICAAFVSPSPLQSLLKNPFLLGVVE